MAHLPAVNVGDRVQVLGEGRAISDNQEFKTWEVLMEQTGMILTEARYKLDLFEMTAQSQ